MLDQVVIQSSTPTTLNVSDVDPDEILLIKSIAGLSPKGLTLFTGEFARDGGYYQGRRAGKRNPVFTFKLNPNYGEDIEVSDIRELLYKMFLQPQVGSDAVQVLLKDDRKPDRYFIGYTEDIDTDMWTAEQTAMVSMICTDPYLRSADPTTGSNPAGWLSVPLTYDGSAGTGFVVQLKVTTANSQVTLDLNGNLMVLTGTFALNDIIDISTVEGSRYIRQNGVDIMGKLSATSTWLQLSAVSNTLQTYSTVVGDAKVKVLSYSYRSAWWGI
jgi:hypothetical protein